MIDKTCTPANRETVVLVFLWIVKRIMTTSHVNPRDDVFREKKVWGNRKCEYHRAEKNVYGKKGGASDRWWAPQCSLKLRINVNDAIVGMRCWHDLLLPIKMAKRWSHRSSAWDKNRVLQFGDCRRVSRLKAVYVEYYKNVLSFFTVKPKIAAKIKRGNQELKYNAVLLSHLPRKSLLLCNRQVKEQLTSID